MPEYPGNQDKPVALITGGTLGIGAATAIALAKDGYDISLAARNTKDLEVQRDIEALKARCHTIQADVSQEASCKLVVEETISKFGRLDVLVHSAGGPALGGLLTGAEKVWYNAFDIHLHAAFHLSRFAVPHMTHGDSSIIFISSAAGLRGVKNALAYSVVKGALFQLTKSMALELAPLKIRVNCVSPGVIRTRFQDILTEEQVQNNLKNRIPVGYEGKPSDVADAISMLVKNTFITGENITIDGGMTMRIV
jgi:NAD(P)-dependent dehydrogenase (short-subunit alcohol dehydrogenase family)